MALDEHAKLISPWYGPVTIFKDIGQNKYIIIDDNTNPVIVPSVEDKGEDIPTMEPVIKPTAVQTGSMDVEIPSETHKRTHQGQVQCIQNTMPILSRQANQKPDWEW